MEETYPFIDIRKQLWNREPQSRKKHVLGRGVTSSVAQESVQIVSFSIALISNNELVIDNRVTVKWGVSICDGVIIKDVFCWAMRCFHK